ncbi:MAG: tetratricopeptide repeat protein [Mucilaginibacter sp.]|uniref:tetratricopeptide repeat protein n=1 Tax=Mucilaginibacter sp. TaxID=1882438 RepID=UPI003265D84B
MLDIKRILADDDLYKIEIDNIEAGKDISIELKQYISQNTDYINLIDQIDIISKKLEKSDKVDEKYILGVDLQALREKEKTFKIQLLKYFKHVHSPSNDNSSKIVELRNPDLMMDLEKSGEILNSIQLQNDCDILTSHIELNNDLEVVYEKLTINSQEFLVKALLTVINFNLTDRFEQTKLYYNKCLISAERALTKLDNFVNCLFSYGHFLQSHNEFNSAELQYSRAIALATESLVNDEQTKLTIAGLLNNSANILMKKQDYESAIKKSKESLSIYESLFSLHNTGHLRASVGTLTLNIGIAEMHLLHYKESEEYLLKGFSIVTEFLSNESIISDAYHNLGELYLAKKEFGKAINYYTEALKLKDTIVERDIKFKSQLALTLNSLGIAHTNQNDLNAAKYFYEQALQLRRELAEKNPHSYLPDLARTLFNITKIFLLLNDQKFLKTGEEALEIYRGLAIVNPEAYMQDVAVCLSNNTKIYLNIDDLVNAEKCISESVNIRRFYVEKYGAAHLPYLAYSLINASHISFDLKKFEDAEKQTLEAIKIIQDLSIVNPTVFKPKLAHYVDLLATIYHEKKDFKKAIELWLYAYKINSELASLDPKAYKPQLAITCNNLANGYISLNDRSEAYIFLIKSIFPELHEPQHNDILKAIEKNANSLGYKFDSNGALQPVPVNFVYNYIKRN